jgi:membrane dipeptidase
MLTLNVSGFPTLIAELLRRGYTDDEVVAIMGGNLQRVLQRAEQVAQQLQQEEVQNEARLFYSDACRSEF